MWLTSCIRWVLSTRSPLFGIAVLVVVHACTWGFLIACGFGVVYGHRWYVVSICATIAVACAAGLLVLRRWLNAADAARQFRRDWRTYRVPIGDAEDQTFQGAASP